jgi:biopolymer transport protein ExbD
MRVKRPDEEPFEIMLIPMIDCMLVIIIFFLVATTLKHRQEKELPLELPKSAAALQVEQPPNLFVISVDKKGSIYLKAKERPERVNYEQLHARVREAAAANPNQHVRIDGDRDARFEDIVHIVDLCQFEGLHNVGLHTKSDGAN